MISKQAKELCRQSVTAFVQHATHFHSDLDYDHGMVWILPSQIPKPLIKNVQSAFNILAYRLKQFRE